MMGGEVLCVLRRPDGDYENTYHLLDGATCDYSIIGEY